jgi:hypothetical protein
LQTAKPNRFRANRFLESFSRIVFSNRFLESFSRIVFLGRNIVIELLVGFVGRMAPDSSRLFARMWNLVLLPFAMALLFGCSNSFFSTVSSDTVSATNGEEVTLESYRDKKVLIPVPPGNRNPSISWATLYDNLPGQPRREIVQKDGSLKI